MRRPRIRVWMLMAYVAAVALGCVVTKFMLKPRPNCTMGLDEARLNLLELNSKQSGQANP